MVFTVHKDAVIGEQNLSASQKHIEGDCIAHWHEFFEIEYIIRGEGVYTINKKQYPIQSGMLFFITPVDFHTVHNANADIINIMFLANIATPSYLSTFTQIDLPKTIVLPHHMRSFIELLLAEIVENQSNPDYCSALLDCLLLKLAPSFTETTQSNDYKLSQKMHFYVINHFKERISLDDVAKQAAITPTYASALFKKEMKTSFKKYLNALRLEYAGQLLLHSDMTVLQICQESGFDDYPNFLRRFKQHFSITPKQYRQQEKR